MPEPLYSDFISSPADNALSIVAGVAASVIVPVLLVVVALVVIVVMRRMRTRKDAESLSFQQERARHEGEHPTVTSMYQSAYEIPEIQHRLSVDISGHYETFAGAAYPVAANSINTHDGARYSEITQGPAGGGGYEVEGIYEEPESSSAAVTANGMQITKNKMAGTAQKESLSKPVNLNELYAQPDKSKKSGKRLSNQQQLQPVTGPKQLYTQPNKTHSATGMYEAGENIEGPPDLPPPYVPDEEQYYNTRGATGMYEAGENIEGRPDLPLPCVPDEEQYYNTRGAIGMYVARENMEGPPDLAPPCVPDEEQYYNTRGGAGPPSQERNYDYVELDWSQK